MVGSSKNDISGSSTWSTSLTCAMTSMAFIMGVVPLVTSTGAGAEMRHAMGIAVFSGMLGVTGFGLFLTPLFYVLVRKLSARASARDTGTPATLLKAPL